MRQPSINKEKIYRQLRTVQNTHVQLLQDIAELKKSQPDSELLSKKLEEQWLVRVQMESLIAQLKDIEKGKTNILATSPTKTQFDDQFSRMWSITSFILMLCVAGIASNISAKLAISSTFFWTTNLVVFIAFSVFGHQKKINNDWYSSTILFSCILASTVYFFTYSLLLLIGLLSPPGAQGLGGLAVLFAFPLILLITFFVSDPSISSFVPSHPFGFLVICVIIVAGSMLGKRMCSITEPSELF